jgi:hypothetical protein
MFSLVDGALAVVGANPNSVAPRFGGLLVISAR